MIQRHYWRTIVLGKSDCTWRRIHNAKHITLFYEVLRLSDYQQVRVQTGNGPFESIWPDEGLSKADYLSELAALGKGIQSNFIIRPTK